MTDAPKVVTICGSMRFHRQMLQVARDKTIAGEIVLMPFVLPGDVTSAQKERLDILHRRKIDMSSDVYVVSDSTGYFGESTQNEINYALKNWHEVIFIRM